MERLEFSIGYFNQADLLVALGRWIEVKHMDELFLGANTINTANALHEAGGIPRGVVVKDDVCTMEINAFSKDLCGD